MRDDEPGLVFPVAIAYVDMEDGRYSLRTVARVGPIITESMREPVMLHCPDCARVFGPCTLSSLLAHHRAGLPLIVE